MESSDCCGKSIARKNDELHEDHRSEHVLEKSKTRKHAPGCLKFRRISEEEKRNEIASCYDKFALAKRLYAENLQHQPLPDRVDDSVFKKKHHCRSASCERDARYQNRENVERRREEDRLFRPALGYKKPKTRMDLAICWETPVDPVYEPHRPTHIDGSEGGSAPAIFALIQHMPRNRELLIRSEEKKECDCAGQEEAGKDSRRNRCGCDCSCNEPVAEPRGGSFRSGSSRSGKSSRSNSLPRITERKCTACRNKPQAELEQRGKDPRLIRSAVGVALGLERKNRTTMGDDEARRKKLPSMRLTVPRPRTPFARRAFSIDTLAPPFSIVKGCRDADYPEHWRLMSVYQQSYRNPQKRKTHYF